MCGWFYFQGDTGYMLDGSQKINNLYQDFRKQPYLIQNRTLFYEQKLGDSFLIVDKKKKKEKKKKWHLWLALSVDDNQ